MYTYKFPLTCKLDLGYRKSKPGLFGFFRDKYQIWG
jgi:hypothetical protein